MHKGDESNLVLNSTCFKSKLLEIHRTSFEKWTEGACCNKNQTTLVKTTVAHPQKEKVKTNIVRYCEFSRNHQFQIFQKKLKIKELLILGLKKKIEPKNQQFQVFQNPQRTVGFHERFTGFYTVVFCF